MDCSEKYFQVYILAKTSAITLQIKREIGIDFWVEKNKSVVFRSDSTSDSWWILGGYKFIKFFIRVVYLGGKGAGNPRLTLLLINYNISLPNFKQPMLFLFNSIF